jgi:CubicO group peptidase (beta-lactamase class C family)
MRSRLLLAPLGVLLCCVWGCQERDDTGPDPTTTLDAFVEDVMERLEIPGLAIAVTQGNEVVYTGAFGVRNLETGEPIVPESLFHMASVSKPFVATAVMQLVEKGKVDLDERVVAYLPYFELADERSGQITVRQMLNHTSGMPDVEDYEWGSPQLDEGAAERYVRSLATQEMIAAPGERWRYSNMAFDTMGDLIAKVSGLPFEVYVKENILDPLGMTTSTFLYPETPPERRTTGHVWRLGPAVSDVYPYNRRHAPSSTLNSSVLEMTRWARANLNRGVLDGRRILPEESYEVLWTPSAEVSDDTRVGLSWFLGQHQGSRTIGHGGSDTGFRSDIILLPDEGIGVVIASNAQWAPVGEIRDGVLDILLGHEPAVVRQPVASPFARTLVKDGLEAAKRQYRRLQAEAADEYVFDPGQLNDVGYALLAENDAPRAIEVFEFNVELYPEVGNTWDSLGEACVANGDRERAIRSYRKALDLDPDNDNARATLKRLESAAP